MFEFRSGLALSMLVILLLSVLLTGCGSSSGASDSSVNIGQRAEASGIEITLESLQATAFTTEAMLEVTPGPDYDIDSPEIVPIDPEDIDTTGFHALPINPGGLPAGSDGGSATVRLRLGPIDQRTDRATVTIHDLGIHGAGEHDSRSVAGPWTFKFSTADIPTEPVRSLSVDRAFKHGESSIAVEQILVSEAEIAIAYSADLGDGALPMGSLLSVQTATGETLDGTSIPAPKQDVTDTRMTVFQIAPADSSTIEIVPGRFTLAEEHAVEVTFPISGDLLGPVDEPATQAINADIELGGQPATVTRIRAARQPEGEVFEVTANSTERNSEFVYLLAPEGDDPVVTDDVGNSYANTGGGFGQGTTGMIFKGPIDPAASELTLSVTEIGREVGFADTMTVDISRP